LHAKKRFFRGEDNRLMTANGKAGKPGATGDTPPPLARIVEALLFVGGTPLCAERASAAVRGLTPEAFQQTIIGLNEEYREQDRPFRIEAQGAGYSLTLRPRYRSLVEKLTQTTRQARLSALAIEVLALIAYKQPVSKPEIDSLRGADSGSVIRQLLKRGLIAVVQRSEAEQQEVAFGTTERFLEHFQLRGLEDLPRTLDLQQI
jgi:segregation and condensation protein B